jgi:hypothetical protein
MVAGAPGGAYCADNCVAPPMTPMLLIERSWGGGVSSRLAPRTRLDYQ